MVITIEATAWAVAVSAGMTSGIVLGYAINAISLASVTVIGAFATLICSRLLRAL